MKKNNQPINWRENIISDILDGLTIGNIVDKWEVDENDFVLKLRNLKSEDFHDLIERVEDFWKRNLTLEPGRSN